MAVITSKKDKTESGAVEREEWEVITSENARTIRPTSCDHRSCVC